MLGYLIWHPLFPVSCLLIAALFLLPVVRTRTTQGSTFPSWPCYWGAASWALFGLMDVVARIQRADIRVDVIVLGPVLILITLVCLVRILAWTLEAANRARAYR
jgi:hypothetical protein